MTQQDRARTFHALHKADDPLRLYNIWDAATAQAAERAGYAAVATGSWSVAAAQGYGDGEEIPFDFLLRIISRIAASVTVPLSVDFECGYARDDTELAQNIRALLDAGAVGINVEDQQLGGSGLVPVSNHAARIAVIAKAAKNAGVPLFINARTDLFLQETDITQHDALLDAAIKRAKVYHAAGASGFFAPGLSNLDVIARLARAIDLPLNIMAAPDTPSAQTLASLGVARISHGPAPFRTAIEQFEQAASAALG